MDISGIYCCTRCVICMKFHIVSKDGSLANNHGKVF